MQTKRTTMIHFESKEDMVNAMYELGFNVRTTRQYETYIDPIDKKELEHYEMKLLEKHGIKCEKVMCWSRTMNNYCLSYKIQDKLNTIMSVYIWSSSIECITYNKTIEEHREEVMKLYSLLKQLEYSVSHKCETEITEDNC